MAFFFSLAACCSLFFPDFLLGHCLNLISARVSFLSFFSFFFSFSIISGMKKRNYVLFCCWLAQSIQIAHWLYFGLPIHSKDLPKIFSEFSEILDTSRDVSFNLLLPYLITLFITGLGYILTARLPFKKIPFSFLPLFIMPCYFLFKGEKMFRVQIHSSTPYATVRAFSNFLVWHHVKNIQSVSYSVTYGVPVHKKILLILGESMNPDYSYNTKDTPFLWSLKPFWRVGYSFGVTTLESLEMFLNMKEFDLQQQTNLFRLAQHQKYHIAFFSAQTANLLTRCGLKFIDHFISSDDMNEDPSLKTDEKLLDMVKNFVWHDQQFLVLHVRHAHSPYSEFSKEKIRGKNRYEQTVSSYRSVMRYHDFWLKRLFKILPQDIQIIFVSDHGEMMGPQFYGHAFEHPDVHRIPVWTYPYKKLPKTQEDITKEIAKWMGVDVIKN